jgi:hypothetical protein
MLPFPPSSHPLGTSPPISPSGAPLLLLPLPLVGCLPPPTLPTREEALEMLAAHAASQGHPSVEAWLRAANRPNVFYETMDLLLISLQVLGPEAAAAAADFFCKFGAPCSSSQGGADVPKRGYAVGVDLSAFHPSYWDPYDPSGQTASAENDMYPYFYLGATVESK